MTRLPLAAFGIAAMFAGAAQAQPAPSNTNPDRSFAQQAASSGLAEVYAGKLALQKTRDHRVQSIAKRMVHDHTKANQQLQALAREEGLKLPTEPSSADSAPIERLQGLSGKDFDRVYIQDQLTAHQQAVALFTGESQSGKDARLKQFATATLPTLRQHLKMVQGN